MSFFIRPKDQVSCRTINPDNGTWGDVLDAAGLEEKDSYTEAECIQMIPHAPEWMHPFLESWIKGGGSEAKRGSAMHDPFLPSQL